MKYFLFLILLFCFNAYSSKVPFNLDEDKLFVIGENINASDIDIKDLLPHKKSEQKGKSSTTEHNTETEQVISFSKNLDTGSKNTYKASDPALKEEVNATEIKSVKLNKENLDHPPVPDNLIKLDQNLDLMSENDLAQLKKQVLSSSNSNNLEVTSNEQSTLPSNNLDTMALELRSEKLQLEKLKQDLVDMKKKQNSSTVLTSKDFQFRK